MYVYTSSKCMLSTDPDISLLINGMVAVEVYHLWSSVHGSGVPLNLEGGMTQYIAVQTE